MADKDTTATTKVEAASRKRASNPARGAKPGERRGGRQKGTPNKANRTLKEAAREYTEQALQTLVQIALGGESEAARVSAANAILDRGYGKPSQVLAGDEEGGAVKLVQRILIEGVQP